jgi:phage-related protein
MSEVWINDIDLADYGFILGADPKHASSPDFTDATAPLLGALGPTWLGEPVQAGSRKLLVSGYIVTASAALYRQNVDALKAIATSGAPRVRFADRPDQEFRDARVLSISVAPRAAILTNLAGDVTIAFDVADPLRYDVNPQGIALSPARASLPVGTAPSPPLIILHGGGASLTNPLLTYRNAAGDSQQTMGFTGVLGASDYLIVDCVQTQVTKSVSGAQSDALSWWTSGDFLTMRPTDGWWELSEYPTLELSASAGAPCGVATYARAWL